ncbi:MAG: ion channel, partial [Candidatus Micrarchaeaceae archaeon]
MRLTAKAAVYFLAISAVFIFGTLGTYILGHFGNNFNEKINTMFDASYFTLITISTVGYGDIVPITPIARFFVMILIVTGLGVFLSAVTVLSSDLMGNRVEKLSGKITNFERRFLKEHILLIGTDTVNMQIAKKLKSEGKKFILITSDKTIADRLRELGYRAYIADETNEVDMSKFEIGSAKDIIVDMRYKSKMIYLLLIVRNLAKNARVTTVVHSAEEEKNVMSLNSKINIMNPAEIASQILTKKI